MPRGRIHKAPQEKTEVKGNMALNYNKTREHYKSYIKDYGQLQIQFCISVHK